MNIVLGISGGIAAYKTPELVRRLKERGADVQIVLTASAGEFVTETTLQAVSGRPIRDNLWDKEAEASMSHIELARWADVVLIAPATAEIIARLAGGSAPDLLATLCLATEAPIVVAPAMNHVMWKNPAVQANRDLLAGRGIHIVGPDHGDQACGETGSGRMSEPDVIAAAVMARVQASGRLAGKTVLITAGPTREAIDPVRYLSNRSSGKMGYALAEAARAQGADVILVSGPVNLAAPAGVERIDVTTAEEMHHATHDKVGESDIFIGAAAVADYRPANVSSIKIKKTESAMSIELVRTEDILASVAALPEAPFTVGFAAETENLREYAMKKLAAKRLDMIVANKVGERLAFDCDDNCVDVYWPDGARSFEQQRKADLAHGLVALIADRYEQVRGTGTEPRLSVISSKD
ncbi:MAG: bifunctional phosphopantothenoylcysteine decarboxylase/phosphopantothenate--cysteine ligase CoaBC [Woeseiaceae bacterium]|nr:bifunctional phosphopantothenoylcysteine decarboxylase/phosphopantothenate--cysteine ligase CoaBC [Woeseiaceae bacterium]